MNNNICLFVYIGGIGLLSPNTFWSYFLLTSKTYLSMSKHNMLRIARKTERSRRILFYSKHKQAPICRPFLTRERKREVFLIIRSVSQNQKLAKVSSLCAFLSREFFVQSLLGMPPRNCWHDLRGRKLTYWHETVPTSLLFKAPRNASARGAANRKRFSLQTGIVLFLPRLCVFLLGKRQKAVLVVPATGIVSFMTGCVWQSHLRVAC